MKIKKELKGFPFYFGEKARFKKGDLVALPTIFGKLIYAGVVVGKGKDKYGEHQKIKVIKSTTKRHKIGEIVKARLMDLAYLQKFGEIPESEIKKIKIKYLKKLGKMI